MTQPLTSAQLQAIYNLAIGVTEGYKAPYKLVDISSAYQGSVTSQVRQEALGLTLLKGKTYDEIKAARSETGADGKPTARAIEASKLFDSVNRSLGASGYSFSLGQLDLGQRGLDKASNYGVDPADLVSPSESLSDYIARQVNAANPGLNLSGSNLRLKLTDLKIDDTKALSSDKVNAINRWLSSDAGTRFVDKVDATIKNETVNVVKADLDALAGRGWSTGDLYSAAAYLMKSYNQSKTAFTGTSTKDGQTDYLDEPSATLDGLHRFTTGLGNPTLDPGKAEAAVQVLGALATSDTFGGLWGRIANTARDTSPGMYADPAVGTIFDLMAGGNARQFVASVRAVDDADQIAPLLFNTDNGLAISDTQSRRIFLPEGNGKYTVMGQGVDGSVVVTRGQPLTFKAVSDGDDYQLTDSTGRNLGTLRNGKVGVVAATGKTQYVDIPAGSDLANGELATIGRWLGSGDVRASAAAAKSLVKDFDWPAGSYELTDANGGSSGSKALVEATKPKAPSLGMKKVSDDLSDEGRDDGNVDVVVVSTGLDGERTLERTDTDPQTGATEYRRLVMDSQGNCVNFFLRIDHEDGTFEELDNRYTPGNTGPTLVSQSYTTSLAETGEVSKIVDTYVFGGPMRVEYAGNASDGVKAVAATDTRGALGDEALAMLNRIDVTPEGLMSGHFPASATEALVTLGARVNMFEAGEDLIEDAGGSIVRTGQSTFEIQEGDSTTIWKINGSRVEVEDPSGAVISVSDVSVDDHGFVTRRTTFLDGHTVTEQRDASGQLIGSRETLFSGDSAIDRSYDANHALLSTTLSRAYADGSSETTTNYADGASVHLTYDPDGNVVSSTGNAAPLQTIGISVQDLNSLVEAIRAGKPLPILTSGTHLLNDLSNPVVNATQVLNNQPLFTTNAVVGAIGSLYGLYNTFQNGSTLDQISASANALVAVNSAVTAVTYGSVTLLSQGAAQTIGEAVPFLGAAVALEHGDYAGAAVAVASYFVPVVGWIYGAYSLITSLDSEPPEAWGTARFQFTHGTNVGVASDGAAIGLGKVDLLTKGNGLSPTNPDGTRNPNYFGGLLGYLDDVLAQSAQANPNVPLGIIPQRLPTLTWHEARQDDPGYQVTDIDPITGEAHFPTLRYNDDFTPFNADATDPAQRRDLFQRMVDSPLQREAIAPMWEVQTARLQQDIGDPDAGLTEEERAGHHGLSAAADASGHRLPGQFRPVVLDLNGDGSITTVSDAASDVGFDWDDSGYIKQAGWIGSGDGFLVLDRNLNGAADSGRELFSNSLVSDAAKGVRSMAWVDANADGVIDASDPVFGALRVWQDANQNGTQDAGETHTLSDLGITKLDYGSSRFTRNGQDYALQSPNIEASNEGVRVNVVQGGIQVDYSDGRSTLIVTQVTDLGGGSGQGTGFVARDDGFISWEDGVSPGNPSDPGYPHAQQPSDNLPISIPLAQLLANDAFNGSNAGLLVTAMGSSQHGTAVLNTAQGMVEFTPEHNYAGQASFEYTVASPDGQTRTANAIIDLQAVNDAPSVSTVLDQNVVYGWGVYAHGDWINLGSENGSEYRVTVQGDKGIPMYSPYDTVGGQNMTWVTSGESGYFTYGPVVDTGIPKDYFDHQYAVIASQQGGAENGGAPNGITIVLDGQTYYIAAAPALYSHATPLSSEISNDGHVSAIDPDGPGQFKYELYQDALYGHAVIDASTGQFTYTGERYVEQNLFGESVGANVDTDDHTRYEETHPDVFQVKVTDLSDSTGKTFTIQDVEVTHFGPPPNPIVASGGGKKPIAIDLNGDGFHFTDVDDSNVFFDVNGDGWKRKIAWNNPDDGFIAYDKNGDGKIDRFDEISFVPYKADGQTDLEGLRAFDTNGDGVFSALDDKWSSFGVWRDANSDGVTDPGEFKSLSDMGITSVALTSDGHFQVVNGQSVHGIGAATTSDGGTLALADVTLRYKNLTQVTTPQGSTTASVPVYTQGQVFTGTADGDLVLGTSGSDQYHLGAGNDVVNDDGGDDLVDAGAGDDTLFTGAGKDYVDAGDGADSVFTGDGDDLAIAGAGDDFLSMGSGNDVAFGGDGNDFVSGGAGNDLLSGDAGDDKLFGEGGRDVLFGMQGNDELWGGDGDDLLHGGAGNDLLAGGTGNDTMDGGAGNDTYDVDSTGDTIVEDADEGIDTVRSSIDYAVGGNLENLTLTGTDAVNGAGNAADNVVIGNEGNNTLRGLDGNDMLDGGAGADTLIAGAGDDTYVIDNAGDVVIESAGEGVDTVRSRISTTLGDNVENLTLIGINAINGGGNALDNVIIGNAAANVLDGGAGADQMRGGLGNDTYAVDNAGDLVTEYVNEGVDTVLASVDYALGANLENLTLTGAATQGSGNELDNVIRGNSLTNRLDGGAGADTLVGGTGDDVYVVDDAGDVVVEQANEGIDTAVASVDYALSANVENLTLTGNATLGTANALDNVLTANDLGDALFGNDGNDTLLGGTGTDTLDGGAGNDILIGGAGADLMRGGAGDDSYVVDDAGDQVVETADAGFDRVSSNIDYVLPENVEQLTLTGTALKGTGNALDNLLFGNDQANVFDGAAGADRMVGGAGDDRYIVDNAADQVVETVDAGNDTVLASTSYALAPNVENLVLTGTDALSGTGNELANVLVGNSAANTLSAGDGDDVLAGGQGDDTLGAGNGDDLYLYFQGDGSDVITDASGTDTLRFGPGMTLDSVAGRLITVNGQTRAFISVLGTDGQETSSGVELVPDANGSFPIEQFQFADGTQFSLSDVLISAQTLNGTSSNDTITGARSDDTIYASDGADTVYARWGNDVVHGGNGNDALFGEGGNDKLYGESGNDALWGGAGDDLMDGGIGADQLMGGTGNDTLLGGNDNDVLDGGAGNDNLSGGNGQDELYGGDGNDAMDGGADADLLAAGAGNDSVAGGDGTDVIVAGAGDDTVDGGNLNDSVDAGDGDDVITGGKGTDIIIGGRGNDTYDPGADQDIIAFNRGDGADTFLTSSNQSDTLSLGGGIRYADLSLSKVGTNLVLNLGSDESITFKDWYLDGTRRNIATLQMITAAAGGDYNPSSSDRMLNSKAVTFDFAKLVNNFGKALAADPSLTTWPLARQLNAAYVKGSNTQAIGGDLAYRYATMGNYGDLTWQAVSTRLASTSGSGWQTLAAPSSTVNPWTALQAGISLIADQTVGLPTPITPHATVSADDLAFAALSAGSVKPSWLQTPHAVGP